MEAIHTSPIVDLARETVAPEIEIAPFAPAMVPAVVRMMARAFVTSPTHIAAFGAAQLASNEVFFAGIPAFKGQKLVAMEGSQVVGFAHWIAYPHCRFSDEMRAQMGQVLTEHLGAETARRVGEWFGAWTAHDPDRAHVHLGPIGVEPEKQGLGIGSRLMARFCAELDAANLPGYLETDRLKNVRFYQRFGFAVSEEIEVLGRRHWLMWRDASSLPS